MPDPNGATGSQGGADGDQDQESKLSEKEVTRIVSERISQITATHTAEMNALRSEMKPAEQAPKIYTATELNTAIEAGTISKTDAEGILAKQQQQQTTDTATAVARQTVESMNQTTQTQASIDKYKEHDADLKNPGTAARNRIEAEVLAQMAIHGVPQSTPGLELTALRVVYGPEDSLGGKERERQHYQETGGGSDDTTGKKDDGAPKGLSAARKAYYQQRLDAKDSRYPDGWKSVAKEVVGADKAMLARADARD